jgi:ABC-type multidrug transport system permease subunit
MSMNETLANRYRSFNIFAAVGIYWLARVPKNAGKKKEEKAAE